jgi:hypothetical protein
MTDFGKSTCTKPAKRKPADKRIKLFQMVVPAILIPSNANDLSRIRANNNKPRVITTRMVVEGFIIFLLEDFLFIG